MNNHISALVAKHVMGWRVEKQVVAGGLHRFPFRVFHPDGYSFGSTTGDLSQIVGYKYEDGTEGRYVVPPYANDIAAAWLVVDHITEMSCELLPFNKSCDFKHIARFWTHEAIADTMPLAICLAALKAVGVEVEI